MRDVRIVLKLHTRNAHLDGEIRGSFSADGQRRSIVQAFTAALQSAQPGWQIEDKSAELSSGAALLAGQTPPALDLEPLKVLAGTHRFPRRDPFAEELSAAIFTLIAEIERLRA